MQLTSVLLFVLSFALTHAFKIGDDSAYGSFYVPNSAYKLNPYYFGTTPFKKAFTFRPKFNPAYVETFTPTANNVLITDPGHMPHSFPTAWQLGISSVVAAGPGAVAMGIMEGMLVYSAAECPIYNKVWLNKPTGEPSQICRSISPQVTDQWCQLRSCSQLIADKCQWMDPSLNSPSFNSPSTFGGFAATVTSTLTADTRPIDSRFAAPTYCVLQATALKGIVTVSSYGLDRNQPMVSRIEKPRDRWMSWRREELNRDVTNAI